MRVDDVRFRDGTICPTKRYSDAAGFELYSVENVLVPPSTLKLLRTNIEFKILRDYFRKTYPSSSFALRFTDARGGVIDTNYRGPVSIFLPDLLRLKRAQDFPR